MNDNERKRAAKAFAEYWKDRGDEKSDSQSFWLSLARDVLGVKEPEKFILFEERVKLDHTSFIDGHIPSTHVLIEQKKKGLNLRSPIRQSDGTLLNPFQQAQRYSAALPYSQRPRWIITCNFEEFLIYDMEKPNGEPESILLKDLGKEYYRLQFLVEEKSELLHREEQVSIKAGELVGKLYDAILKQYIDPGSKESLRSLNMLCVRLVFCLYAEDAGIFGGHLKFHNYIKSFNVKDVRRALIDLFRVLDTPDGTNGIPSQRDPYMDDVLAAFPYVNGGLFADENIEIPNFTQEIVDLLLHNASEDFDWSQISPTIFGAVFESTLNPETRRSGGMHYTSVENIHKVIRPLFLDELEEELEEIKAVKVPKIQKDKAEAFREKLSTLVFLDPACGSGNFLTQTYIELRRLENEALKIINEEQIMLDLDGIIKVSIGQFYGIEINDFAVTVAKTALWIAESQMMKETEEILNANLDFLPLKSYANIVEGNALRIDWETVVPKDKLNYIMGNPPFVGTKMMTAEQKQDTKAVIGEWKNYGTLDYVACWYKKASDYIINTQIKCAFVSTNSICQGEQVAYLWKPLFGVGIQIVFAHGTFQWDSEASLKAHVHCVIVGFAMSSFNARKLLFTNGRYREADNINGYLVDAPNVFIENRKLPICSVSAMHNGCKFLDDGHYVFTEEEMLEFVQKDTAAVPFIKPYLGAQNFINGEKLFCIWLKNANPADMRQSHSIMDRVKKVREFRLSCKSPDTQKYADRPTLPTRLAYYSEDRNTDVLLVPIVSSESRKYIPIGYVDKGTIVSYSCMVVPEASLYEFGIMTSNVHNAWLKTVCGRLEMRYRYSNTIVYNNFPWPTPDDAQKKKIEETAQAILDARALYPDCSLADLYDEVAMPPELRKAHQANDRAVMQAYGFWGKLNTESECVAELMKMYQELTSKE
ncbi:MAG: SAM-dependent DNA methyltransferase [Clostridia bacterium]|nr:SAM-dependent DNA methyltransferase [Clostridia bacterium]